MPRHVLPECRDIIDISRQCSKTAAELLIELEKLQLDSNGGLRQAVSKSVRAMRRKSFIKDIQDKLDRYQSILDARILVGLDAHSIQQTKDFQSLDRGVQDLIVAMSQGHTTVAQLLKNQSQALHDHIDRRFDDHAQTSYDLRTQQQVKESLFFPEMFARQEQIPKAHQGTCRWIFHPPISDKSKDPVLKEIGDSDNGVDEGHEGIVVEDLVPTSRWGSKGSNDFDDENADHYRERSIDDTSSHPWSNFISWLECGERVYWLNGKPGAGKSTLMKYIATEFQTNAQTQEALSKCSNGSDLVTASFFFWSPGTVLQKSFQGLLRSLLFQIAEHRRDLISTIVGKQTSSVEETTEFIPVRIHTWTEQRLLSALQRLLTHGTSSISFFFFIDGLDEFAGDEDLLIETIRLLNNTPQAKVCVSSRPEQIFRQEFSQSPQLRLQDFNYRDMKKTAMDSLLPFLRRRFPREEEKVDGLVKDLISKAQGVFLWLNLIIKDLKNGARNSDTMHELHARLQITPDTIEGLYEHMLNRLDKLYLQDASKYFRMLMLGPRTYNDRPLTLLEFVCAESVPWEHVLKNDRTYIESLEFQDLCQNYETRILTRCAGLIETVENRYHDLPGLLRRKSSRMNDLGVRSGAERVATSQEEQNISRHLRGVKYIHRTAIDFLRNHRGAFFQESNWHSAIVELVRGKLGLMSIFPSAKSEVVFTKFSKLKDEPLIMANLIEEIMLLIVILDELIPIKEADRTATNVAIEMVDHTYRIVGQINASLHGPKLPWYERYNLSNLGGIGHVQLPFHDCPGFAAFFACGSYIMRYISMHKCPPHELDYLLACTLIGLKCQHADRLTLWISGYLMITGELLCQGTNPNLSLYMDSGRNYNFIFDLSAWGSFFKTTVPKLLYTLDNNIHDHPAAHYQNLERFSPCLLLWKNSLITWLSHGAEIDTSILTFVEYSSEFDIDLVFEESPLSYWNRMTASIPTKMAEIVNDFAVVKDLLLSHGALQRRRFRLICSVGTRKDTLWYYLSQEQSDRLGKVWPWGLTSVRVEEERDPGSIEALRCVLEEIKASLTEADEVNTSNLIIRSSFDWERDEDAKETRFADYLTSRFVPGLGAGQSTISLPISKGLTRTIDKNGEQTD